MFRFRAPPALSATPQVLRPPRARALAARASTAPKGPLLRQPALLAPLATPQGSRPRRARVNAAWASTVPKGPSFPCHALLAPLEIQQAYQFRLARASALPDTTAQATRSARPRAQDHAVRGTPVRQGRRFRRGAARATTAQLEQPLRRLAPREHTGRRLHCLPLPAPASASPGTIAPRDRPPRTPLPVHAVALEQWYQFCARRQLLQHKREVRRTAEAPLLRSHK